MNIKRKIVDIFFYNGELELLNFRIQELSPFVTVFVVVELFGGVSYINKDIIHISSKGDIISSFDDITKTIFELNLSFEDIVIVSNVNEVPDLSNLEEIIKDIDYGTIILNHQKFVWNIEYVDSKNILGSMVFLFTTILQNKKIIEQTYDIKINNDKTTIMKLLNGWCFSSFGKEKTKDNKYNMEEELPDCEIDAIKTYPLTKTNDQTKLPNNISLLPYVKIGREYAKKHLLIIDPIMKISIPYFEDNYDTVSIVEFSTNLSEIIANPISDRTTKSMLYLPNIILYGNNNIVTFQNQYKINEGKRILHSVFPKKQDSIRIFFQDSAIN